MSLMKRGKDKLISKALEKFLESYITEYGDILDFKIDSAKKSIFLSVILQGETEKLDINILGYCLEPSDSKTTFTFDRVETSRQWLTLAINNFAPAYLARKKLEVSPEIAKIFSRIV